MVSRHMHLSAAGNFSVSNGTSRTCSTVKRVAQAKIGSSAKSAGGVGGSADKQASGVQAS